MQVTYVGACERSVDMSRQGRFCDRVAYFELGASVLLPPLNPSRTSTAWRIGCSLAGAKLLERRSLVPIIVRHW